MSDEAVRQTRSQKRALERDSLPVDLDVKKVKMEAGGAERDDRPVLRPRPEAASAPTRGSTFLNASEVKATIKVEVQAREEPVDMSTTRSDVKKEKRPLSPDDVIVLSDNEPSSPQMNGAGHFKELDTDLLMKSSPEERERIIKQLKEELRLEEAKLVLLKKLRQSQIHKDTSAQKTLGSGCVATPPPLVRGTVSSKGAQPVLAGRSSGTVIPPPLVRGGQVSKHGSQNSQIIMPPLVRGAQPISVTPQQIASLRQQQQQQYSGSGPPPLLLAPRAAVPAAAHAQKLIQPGIIRVANVPSANLLVNVSQSTATNLKTSLGSTQGGASSAGDSPASRQAAAKLALRKQLEKTLLEIPPPKPPAPELNFLPSAANNEFIYLVGLEEVVQCLLDALGRGKQGGSQPTTALDPFTCSQCQTDFTCRWRKEKGGAIMCEQCMSTNQKKALKAEHTNRLKAAFVKALQQEQEIEQRILQQASSPLPHSPSTSSSSSSSSAHAAKAESQVILSQHMKQRPATSLQTQQPTRSSQPIGRHHSSISQSSSQLSRSVQQTVGALRGVPHAFSPSSQLQNAVAAAALVSRPGKHAVRQGSKVSTSNNGSGGSRMGGSAGSRNSNPAPSSGWRKQNSVAPGVTMAYVNPSLSVHKTSSSAVERQREYLLDMIPSRSISQTANTWK
ncbi:transcriptional repressor p66-alpha-like isoform X1 [Electrophorus electricus]|uniref:GATA-type domain-containing protein n=1 Tax=Electrophorus electricus TaxID=8005 RepID=A0A4W4HNX9_ELEEL|nr:transcriptional repressor p66-alpha-like isoform X1 [Electrophorus electricus]XP_026874725.2 transcriptional repressor p66-alpha-like isoform X1 [Electrophorus electricus]